MFNHTNLDVLMVSTSYPRNITDWRGVFIRQIVNSLAENKEIKLYLWSPHGDIPSKVAYACKSDEAKWLNNLMEQGGIAHTLRKSGFSRFTAPIKLLWLLNKTYRRMASNIHIYHVNWLQNILPLQRGHQPVLVTVLGQDFGLLNLPGMTGLLRRKFKQRPYLIAPNAEWMVAELQKRFGDLATVKAISFGIDSNWYKINRNWQDQHPKKWLVVSRLTKNKIGYLFKWGESAFHGEHELHLFGPMQEQLEIPKWVYYHGPTYPTELMETWFPKAAGLITLSQHDEGRPQIMLEAMAAGLPILASRLPAHEDLLAHHQTGCLVNSQACFEDEINWLSDFEHNTSIGQQAKAWVRTTIGTWDDCARRYIAAYHELMERL